MVAKFYHRSDPRGGGVCGDREILFKGVGFMVVDGRNVRFWMGEGPLRALSPRIFKIVANKDFSINDCFEWYGGSILWGVSFRSSIQPTQEVSYGKLLGLLSNVFFLYRNSKDSWTWKPSMSGEFSAKSFNFLGLLLPLFGWSWFLFGLRLFVS